MDNQTIYLNATFRALRSAAAWTMRQANRPDAASFGDVLSTAHDQDTLSAYRAAVTERIQAMPMHASHVQDDMFIDISDDGWEAMRQDPEYEAWVLDTIQQHLSTPDPFASLRNGQVVHFRFGASREQYRGDSLPKSSGDIGDFTGTDKKKSYWEERKERMEKEREIEAEIGQARARARAASERARIRGEKSTLPDDASAAPEILEILLAAYMQGL